MQAFPSLGKSFQNWVTKNGRHRSSVVKFSFWVRNVPRMGCVVILEKSHSSHCFVDQSVLVPVVCGEYYNLILIRHALDLLQSYFRRKLMVVTISWWNNIIDNIALYPEKKALYKCRNYHYNYHHYYHCEWMFLNVSVRRIYHPTWIGVLLHILIYFRNENMEYSDFWNTYKAINFYWLLLVGYKV